MEVANVLQAEASDLSKKGKVSMLKNWLGREGLFFIQTPTNAEKEACKSATGLFNVLKGKLRPQHNKMILSIQYCKLQRKKNESIQEVMGRFHIKAAKCNHKVHDRQLKEQFINGRHDEGNHAKNYKRAYCPKEHE